MAMTTVTIEIDENLKLQAEKLFADKGLNMASVFQSFMKRVIKEQEISPAVFGAMNFDESGRKTMEKTESVNPESYAAGHLDISVEEMIDLGGSRSYSTGLYRM